MTRTEFSDMFHSKIQYRTVQRLSAIKEYFAVTYDVIIDASTKDKCLASIFEFCTREPEFEQSVFDSIRDILWDRHSLGDPYYIYNLSPHVSDFSTLARKLNRCLKGEIDQHLFTFNFGRFSFQRKFDVDWENKRIQGVCRYSEFRADYRSERSDEVVYSGQISFLFDFESNRLLVGSGYNKAVSNLVKLINEQCKDLIRCLEINVRSLSTRMPNSTVSDFSALTLLSVYLMQKGLKQSEYEVTNILSILFNNEKAPYVRNAKLSGENLLADYDVAQRVMRPGDKIVFFQVFIRKVSPEGAAIVIFMGDVTFDFRRGLKITIGNGAEKAVPHFETVFALEKIISGALVGPNTVHDAERIIKEELRDAAKSPLERVFRALYKDLLKILPQEQSNVRELFAGYGFEWD